MFSFKTHFMIFFFTDLALKLLDVSIQLGTTQYQPTILPYLCVMRKPGEIFMTNKYIFYEITQLNYSHY